MQRQQAREILQALANGVDPESGELLQTESVFQQPGTIRALFAAIELLRSAENPGAVPRRRPLPEQTGKPWSPGEEAVRAADTTGKDRRDLPDPGGAADGSGKHLISMRRQ